MRIMMMLFYVVLVLIGVSFAALNATSVKINFYFTMIKLPISVLLIVTLGVGIILGWLLSLSRYWRLKVEHRKIKNQLKMTEREIKNLRAIPLSD